jgi:asparagine N-glycosylation enzyme membrane subunit Stt3
MTANRLIAAAGVGFWSAVVIGFILGMLSWIRVVPPEVGWVGTGLFLVPLIGSLVASQRRTRTNPLIAAAYGIALILIGLSWNSVDPPLVSLAGAGISLVATIISRRRKEEPKGDDKARTN